MKYQSNVDEANTKYINERPPHANEKTNESTENDIVQL
jgi:hypothetical protein